MPTVKTILNVLVVSVAVIIGAVVVIHSKNINDPAVTNIQSVADKAKAAAAKETQKKADTTKLTSLVTSFASTYGDKVGVVVSDLSSGGSANVNGSKQFVSASIYKLFVAYGIYAKIDTGTVTLKQTIQTGSGPNTVEGCLNLMITISDNDCGDALGILANWSSLDDILIAQGYKGTMLNNYTKSGALLGDKETTANDVALLLTRLYDGTLLSKESSSTYISLLKAQKINDRLPKGLPVGTVIAHKTGDLYGYLHDAGIIYGMNKDTVVVLLTGDWTSPQTEGIPLFATLARSVWTYMQD